MPKSYTFRSFDGTIRKSIFLEKKTRVRPLMSSRGDYAKYRNGYLYGVVTLQSLLYNGRKYPHKNNKAKAKLKRMSFKMAG